MKSRRFKGITIIVLIVLLIIIGSIIWFFDDFRCFAPSSIRTIPYSKISILNHLERKYSPKFIIKNKIKEENGDIFYLASIYNDNSFTFYVLDNYYSGFSIWENGSPTRVLKDTYGYSLIESDLQNLKNINKDFYIHSKDKLREISEYNIDTVYYPRLSIPLNGFRDISNIANTVHDLTKYIKNNNKYKGTTIQLQIHYNNKYVYDSVISETHQMTTTQIYNLLAENLINVCREHRYAELFKIPVSEKQKYPVTGYFENPYIYVDNKQPNGRVQFSYLNGKLVLSDGIEYIIPLIKDKSDFLNVNSYTIKQNSKPILYAIRRGNNVYLFADGDRGGLNIYLYKDSSSVMVRDGWDNLDLEELKEYLGVTCSYDYSKEILNITK